MFTGIVAAVGRIESVRPLGSEANAGVRLSVDAGSLGLAGAQLLDDRSRLGRHIDVDRRRFDPREPGEGEEVVDQGGHADGRSSDPGEVALGDVVELVARILEEGLAEPVDRAQRCPEVVGDRVAERLELGVGRREVLGDRLRPPDLGHEPLAHLLDRHAGRIIDEATHFAVLCKEPDVGSALEEIARQDIDRSLCLGFEFAYDFRHILLNRMRQ